MAQLRVDYRKFNTANKTNIKRESEIWLLNKSANKTDLDIEKEKNGNHEKDLEGNKFKIEKAVNSEVHKVKVK